ncbi:hypothetical protein [Roseococcus sp.]
MLNDPEPFLEPGGFEPFDRFSSEEADEIDHPDSNDFDPFLVNL